MRTPRGAHADGALIERDEQMQLVLALIRSASGGGGGTLVFEGPPGIGKSTVLDRGASLASESGFIVLRATGTELEQQFVFGGVHQLFGPLLRGASPAQRRRWRAGAAAATDVLFEDVEHVMSPAPEMEFRLLNGLYWLLVQLSDTAPVAVVLDDMHWLDEETRRFVMFLAHRIADLPVALLLGCRDPAERGVPPRLRRTPGVRCLTLTSLSECGIAEMAERSLPGEVTPELVTACRRATGGVPLFAEAVLHGLREATDPVAHVTGVAPAAVVRLITGELAGEPDEVVRVARSLAVLGSAASLRRLSDVCGLSMEESRHAIDRLSALGLLDPTCLALKHVIIGSALIEDLSPAEVSAFHHRAAVRLHSEDADVELVAAHLIRTVPEGEDWTVPVLRAAATSALARGGSRSAATYLRRALADVDAADDRATVAFELGRTLSDADPLAALEHLLFAVDRGHLLPWWADAVRILAGTFSQVGRFDDALNAVEEATARAGTEDPRTARLLVDWFFFAIAAEEYDRAEARVEEVQRLIRAQDATLERLFLGVASMLMAQRNRPALQVAGQGRRAWGSGDLLEIEPPGSPLHWPALVSILVGGDLAAADVAIAQMLAGARTNRSLAGAGMALQLRSLLGLMRGDLAEAGADAREALDLLTSAIPYLAPFPVAQLIEVLLDQGHLDAARELASEWGPDQGPYSSGSGDSLQISWALVDMAEHRWQEAFGKLRAVGDRISGENLPGSPIIRWRGPAALAALGAGDDEAAADLAHENLVLSTEFGAPYPLGIALRVAAQVRRPAEREELLRQSVEVLRDSGHRLEFARSQVHLGNELRKRRRFDEAREHLSSGMDLAMACGARPLAEQAFEELHACGAKPRRLAQTGVAALTPRELRVVQLAAIGDRTNRDIAQELFITDKTVERHLSNAYRKLGIASRSELGRVLEDPA